MKKSIFTLAFAAILQFTSQAQSQDQAKPKENTKKETVNPDGTLAPADQAAGNNGAMKKERAPDEAPAKTDNAIKKDETSPQPASRAITEKGAPTSKGSTNKVKNTAAPKAAESSKTEKK